MPRRGKDDLLGLAEREARKVLRMPGLTAGERLKAVEIITKVAAIRHKITDGGEGGFFHNK